MYYVYVLISKKDQRLYTGFTIDLERRIEAHNKGINRSTKNRRPLCLIYQEEFNTEKEAREREKYLKSGHGRAFLKGRLQNL